MTLRTAEKRRRSPMLAEILMAASRVPRLWMPAVLHPPSPLQQALIGIALPGLLLGGTALAFVPDRRLHWIIILGVAGLTTAGMVAVMRRQARPSLSGCEIDFSSHSIYLHDKGRVVHLPLDQKAHSIGFEAETHKSAYVVHIDLRHARRGTVASLTSLTTAKLPEIAQMEQVADVLAQRLHLRRSGLPLPPLLRQSMASTASH